MTQAPNCGSRTNPAMSSRRPTTISATSRCAAPSSGRRPAHTASAAASTAAASRRSSRTRLRSVLCAVRKRRGDFDRVDGVYGALTPEHIVFGAEFETLRADQINVRVTVTEPMGDWAGPIGRVQTLLPVDQLEHTTALLVGQPEMTEEVTAMLRARGLSAGHAWLNF